VPFATNHGVRISYDVAGHVKVRGTRDCEGVLQSLPLSLDDV